MNKDYNKIMKEQIKNLPKNKKLLLHVCCAPCTSAVLERVKDSYVLKTKSKGEAK